MSSALAQDHQSKLELLFIRSNAQLLLFYARGGSFLEKIKRCVMEFPRFLGVP